MYLVALMGKVLLYTISHGPSPHAGGWYIVFTRPSITQLKSGKVIFGLGFLILSLCFLWILGLLYQGKKTVADGWKGTEETQI